MEWFSESLPRGILIWTQRTTANEIEKLFYEYKKLGIDIKWLIINNDNILVKENKAFFLKRYLLNESKYKDVLILNWDGTEVTQCCGVGR